MNNKFTHEEMLALMNGDDLQEHRRKTAFRSRISAEAEKYLNKPVSDWPEITFNWDVSKESQRFSLDGMPKEKFQEYYPDGFLLGYVDLPKFDRKLCHFSRRDDGELWELGFPSRLAYLIVYLSEGHPISPPLVKATEEHEVIFHGGHHRYAIAKAVGEIRMPIHVCPGDKAIVEKLISIKWGNA